MAISNESGMDDGAARNVMAMNAWLIVYQGLDLQRWFEKQVFRPTKCDSIASTELSRGVNTPWWRSGFIA